MRRLMAGPFVLCSVLACSDSPVDEGEIGACSTDPVAVEVGPGTAPVFDWSPRCRVAGLLVEPTQTGQGGDRWSIQAEGNEIAPPVTFGVVPPEAERVSGPNPMSAGASYRVILWVVAGTSEIMIANQSFTP